jgi:hypothetical protein
MCGSFPPIVGSPQSFSRSFFFFFFFFFPFFPLLPPVMSLQKAFMHATCPVRSTILATRSEFSAVALANFAIKISTFSSMWQTFFAASA